MLTSLTCLPPCLGYLDFLDHLCLDLPLVTQTAYPLYTITPPATSKTFHVLIFTYLNCTGTPTEPLSPLITITLWGNLESPFKLHPSISSVYPIQGRGDWSLSQLP